jgi:hypothetical protein
LKLLFAPNVKAPTGTNLEGAKGKMINIRMSYDISTMTPCRRQHHKEEINKSTPEKISIINHKNSINLIDIEAALKEDNKTTGGKTSSLYYPSGRRRKRKNRRTSIPLPENWREIRAQVIERDKICQICGSVGQGVHHINKDRTCNELSNLIYVCWNCHIKLHHQK